MVKKIISIILALTSVMYSTVPIYAKEIISETNSSQSQTMEVSDSIKKLKTLSDGKLKFQQKDGQVFIAGKLSNKGKAGSEEAIQFLEENKQILGINSARNELQIVESKKDQNGDTFIKFNQVINGVSVKDRIINVHFDKNGTIVSINGKLEKEKSIERVGNKNITERDAVDIATKQYKDKTLAREPQVTKEILNKDNKNYEVFKVNIYYKSPIRGNWDVYVEASSGEIIKTENKIKYDGQVVGTGIDVLGNVKPLNLYQSGSYQMRDLSNPATSSIETYSANNTTTSGTLVTNNTSTFNLETHKASVSAHYNAGKVIDFYKNLFNRNSLDNSSMAIDSYTHYGYHYNNAFWDGEEMVYGDGDGTTFTYLSGDLDVVGHEMTHGVIDNTAKLVYENQSGALNESVADVFGVLIETYNKYNVSSGGSWLFNPADWVVGDEIYTPGIQGDALRSLSNPKLYNQPDNMSGYLYSSNNEAGDYGGVHTNSGIPNKAAYLIAQSIGMEKTAKIYYRALVNYMTSSTNFEEARNLLEQSAADLYGDNSTEVTAISNAFNSVGVGQTAFVIDAYEPNNSIDSAYSIDLDKVYKSFILTSNDVDYYKLIINSKGFLNAKLFDLPKDYNMKLYDSSGNELASSLNPGTSQENIGYYITNPGSYFIKVFTSSEYSQSQEYSVSAQMLYGIGDLENPAANANVNGTINLKGWYLDKAGVKKIAVKVDGIEIGQAIYGDNRSDISNIYPEYKSDTSGFHYDLDTTKISNGIHTVNVEITNNYGDVKALTPRSVNISNIISISSITLDKNQANLRIGESINLIATVAPFSATNKNIIWTSSDNSIASVDNTGKVRAFSAGTAVITAATADGVISSSCSVLVSLPSVAYQGHVQNIGWQDYVKDGALAGTEGQALRVEAFRIKLENAPAGLRIKYKTHVQNIGWQDWVYDDAMAGTQGQSLRVEAVQIMLEGTDADKYSVQYQAHVQNEGWQQWVKDGQIAGTFGKAQRIEALRIKITEKLPSVTYQGHVQNIGWQNYVKDGALAGTEGMALRVEAFRIKLENAPAGLRIKYKTHVQNIGWQDWVYDGAMAGTQGQALRVEAVQIMLEGTNADKYSVQYEAHVQNEGWQPWVKDGEVAGTSGKSQRIEALRITIVKK